LGQSKEIRDRSLASLVSLFVGEARCMEEGTTYFIFFTFSPIDRPFRSLLLLETSGVSLAACTQACTLTVTGHALLPYNLRHPHQQGRSSLIASPTPCRAKERVQGTAGSTRQSNSRVFSKSTQHSLFTFDCIWQFATTTVFCATPQSCVRSLLAPSFVKDIAGWAELVQARVWPLSLSVNCDEPPFFLVLSLLHGPVFAVRLPTPCSNP
jgi:hypothetical protein